MAASRQFLQKNVSKDVLTDYDIMDEVGVFQQSVKPQGKLIDFRDKNMIDPTLEDKDIEDMKLK